MGDGDDAIGAARAAIDRGDWTAALDLLGRVGGDADALELRAAAAYGAGELETALGAWEELSRRLEAHGDRPGAARAAAMLAMFLMMDTGLMAPVRAWLRRAEALVTGDDEIDVHAWVAMVRTYERFMCGDIDAAAGQAARATELGERLGVPSAVAIGRTASARVRILRGDLEGGLRGLDDVAVMLEAGHFDSLTTGMMWCELICAMQGLGRFDLAREWTDAMDRWRRGAAFGGINGRCRVHRAELLRLRGPCDEAEREAQRACDELRPWMRREFGWPLTELGNVRLRKGDLDGAEEAFLAALEHGWSPQPGLALLRLAQGDAPTAAELIRDELEHPVDVPSKERPPFGELCRAPLLDAQVEIAAALGDRVTAEVAAAELAATAKRFASPGLDAASHLGAGRVALLAGDAAAAVRECGLAVVGWAELGAPWETAMARLVLGRAKAEAGNAAGARLEWQVAGVTFERIGARHGARLAAAMAGNDGPAASAPAAAWFRREGDTRHIRFDGADAVVRDLKGMRLLALLLERPGRELHVVDLLALEQGQGPGEVPVAAAMPVLDDAARAAYRRRLDDIEEDLADAEAMNDVDRVALAIRDRDYLVRELSHSTGLGGRDRGVGGTAERARSSATRAIHYAVDRIAEHHGPLAEHLRHSVRTGTYCCYAPDPRAAAEWET